MNQLYQIVTVNIRHLLTLLFTIAGRLEAAYRDNDAMLVRSRCK